MSARDDYRYGERDVQHYMMCGEIDQLRATVDRLLANNAAIRAGAHREVCEVRAQLERTRNEYAAALTRITDAHLTVEACDRILAALKDEGL
jgi:hypothetical protein